MKILSIIPGTLIGIVLSILFLQSINKPEEPKKVAVRIKYEYEFSTLYDNIFGTVYHPVSAQTDGSPFITATNDDFSNKDIKSIRWCALSRDLLDREFIDKRGTRHKWTGKIKLGDTIYVESKCTQANGWWVVKDVMGKYYINKKGDTIQQKKWIDFLQDHRDTSSFLISCPDIKIKKRLIKAGILEFYNP